MSLVTLEIENSIAVLTLNDPERRNAMGAEMAQAFRKTIQDLKKETCVRALIISGAGKAFAAGGDLQMLKAKAKLDESTNHERMLEFYRSFLCLLELKFPVIAAVNGHAIGAGLCVAMACDFRIISDSAKLGFTFTKLALHPGMGATLFLPRIVGTSVATDLLVTGRLFDASEAKSMGICSEVTDTGSVVRAATDIADSIRQTGPEAVADLLATLRPSADELDAALDREARQQAFGYARSEFLEGVNATIEKRAPNFG